MVYEHAAEMKFSLIVPVYNVDKYLHECLDSVLHQECSDFEVICVDDGSTDESGIILDDYQSRFQNLKVHHIANGGVSKARNFGLDHARGEWVWFVDADDVIHPMALRWLKQVIDARPEAETICFTTEEEANLDGATWPELPSVGAVKICTERNSDAVRMHRRAAWGLVLRRSAVGQFRYLPYLIGEDALFNLTVFWHIKKWVCFPAPLYFYRTRSDSAVGRQPDRRMVEDLFKSELSMLQLWQENVDKWVLKEVSTFVTWNRDFVWYTFNGMYFRLPDVDKKILLPKWIEVQLFSQKLFGDVPYRILALAIIRIFGSVLICRLLVLLPLRLKRVLM